MIDRNARNQVRQAIDDFVEDRITNFEFETRLEEIDWNDRTVKHAALLLWGFYDDFREHRVCLNKSGWDAMQRIALLLDSNMQATPKVTRRWHASQWIALGMVAAFLAAGFFAGWPLACLAGVLTSPVYFALKAWRERDAELITPPLRGDLWPFDTFAALRLARIQAGTFRKQPFRMEIENRVIRSARWERFQQAKLCVLQAIAATLLYPFQCFPISKEWNEITPAVE